MAAPRFYVVARVVGRDGALEKWRDRLAGLCAVSKTEPYSDSYYWGYDVDGEPDTLWGLEGYSHPTGFFLGHVSTDTFKAEMRLVDADKLLRHVQGLGSPDYDLHHYDLFGGFVTRANDKDKDAEDSFVAVVHFWAAQGSRKQLLGILADTADRIKEASKTDPSPSVAVQSFAVLKELTDFSLASLYIRTRTQADWDQFQTTKVWKDLLDTVKPVVTKLEIHRSQNFIGHIGQEAPANP